MGLRLSELRACDLCLGSIFDSKRDRMLVITIQEHHLNRPNLRAIGQLMQQGMTLDKAETIAKQSEVTDLANTTTVTIRADLETATIKDILEAQRKQLRRANN